MVYFKCPSCGETHPSRGISVESRRTFEIIQLGESSEPCPTTGEQVTLNRPDFFWKDD
jgi:hypothetical protein